jgi:hypothetical protein
MANPGIPMEWVAAVRSPPLDRFPAGDALTEMAYFLFSASLGFYDCMQEEAVAWLEPVTCGLEEHL